MYPLLGLQKPVGVFPLDLHGDRLDPGLFSRNQVEHAHLIASPLRPAPVHSGKHLGPVLRFGAARPGMNGEDRVAGIVGVAQQGLQLERFENRRDALHLGGELGRQTFIGLGGDQLTHAAGVRQPIPQRPRRHHPALESFHFLDQSTGAIGVGPESGIGLLSFELLQPRFLAGQVKETPKARGSVAPAHPSVRPDWPSPDTLRLKVRLRCEPPPARGEETARFTGRKYNA